jgi:hypothetical protein
MRSRRHETRGPVPVAPARDRAGGVRMLDPAHLQQRVLGNQAVLRPAATPDPARALDPAAVLVLAAPAATAATPTVARLPDEAAPRPAAPRPDLARLADQIYEAIEGLGTDEEAVYRALQELDRDQALIEELKQVYAQRHHASLLEDIYDDFSGTELEYALQLLNLGDPRSAQRIEKGAAATDPKVAAQRLHDAFEIFLGTDEEAVYAALLPFRRDTLKVQRVYQEMFGEDLRDRIEDEMSGSELDYALDLMETPFEHYMQEAASWLKRFPAIGFGLPWKSSDWFDNRFWTAVCSSKECKLVLTSGKPHEAIDAMFHHQERWHVDCAVFVEVVRLYALRQSLGARRFDLRIGSGMELRAHGSTGNVRRVLFKRTTAGEAFAAEGPGAPDVAVGTDPLAEAPIGSRVR